MPQRTAGLNDRVVAEQPANKMAPRKERPTERGESRVNKKVPIPPELLQRTGLAARDLTERELAALESVSVKTVQQWRRTGGGPPFRKLGYGSRAPVRYPVASYQAWRSGTLVKSTAEKVRLPRRSTL